MLKLILTLAAAAVALGFPRGPPAGPMISMDEEDLKVLIAGLDDQRIDSG